VAHLHHLTSLSLTSRGSDPGFGLFGNVHVLAGLTKLAELELDARGMEPPGPIGGSVQRLGPITDSVQRLGPCPALTSLRFSGFNMRSGGPCCEVGIQVLKQLSALKRVYVPGAVSARPGHLRATFRSPRELLSVLPMAAPWQCVSVAIHVSMTTGHEDEDDLTKLAPHLRLLSDVDAWMCGETDDLAAGLRALGTQPTCRRLSVDCPEPHLLRALVACNMPNLRCLDMGFAGFVTLTAQL
jgi:hypothetical protein